VAHPDFFFALDLSDEPHFDRMLALLSEAVLRHLGYDSVAAAALTKEVRAALDAGPAGSPRHCAVRFAAAFGTLRISVRYVGRPAWETTRQLPAMS
jgi:hypothetical protein